MIRLCAGLLVVAVGPAATRGRRLAQERGGALRGRRAPCHHMRMTFALYRGDGPVSSPPPPRRVIP